MNDTFKPAIQTFSESYDLIHNADIHLYGDEEAIMDKIMHEELSRRFGRHFSGKIGSLHYIFKPEQSIPKGSVAVPADNHDNPDALLIKND